MNRNKMPLFQDDYLISWDFSDHDFPCITIMKLERDKAHVLSHLIGISHDKSGIVSLQQLLANNYYNKQQTKNREIDIKCLKEFINKKESTDETTND